MIKFRCSRCNHKIRTTETHAGKVVRCPSCKDLTFVPPSVEEVEAALAAATIDGHTDSPTIIPTAQVGFGPQDKPAPPAQTTPHTHVLKPHHYRWLKFFASAYLVFGGITAILFFIGLVLFVRESMADLSNGAVYSATDLFLTCVWVTGGTIVTVTLFAIGQAAFAFRDMVQNSWVTREMAAVMRTTPRG